MNTDILLTKNPGNGYIARSILWPNVVVSGETESQTIFAMHQALTRLLAESKVIQIELPDLPQEDDPWQRVAGMWAGIPDEQWTRFESAMIDARQTANQQADTDS